MSKKHVTYLQFKSTADKLALTHEQITLNDVYSLLHEIITQEEAESYFDRWQKERPAELDQSQKESLRTKELEHALSVARATLESTADAILIVDQKGNLTDFNQKFLEMSGLPNNVIEKGNENAGLAFLITLLEDPEELIGKIRHLMKYPEEQGDMGDVYFKNGKIVERYSQPHRLAGEIVGRVWSFRDVTEKRKQEALLRLSNRAISASTHGIIIIENNADFKVIHLNDAAIKLLGLNVDDVMQQSFLNISEGFSKHADQFLKIFKGKNKGDLTIQYYLNEQLLWLEISIDPVYDKDTKVITHFVAIINDITKRIELENILKYKAVHDTLTGLPNKNYLEDQVRYRIQSSSKSNEIFALLFIDIDRFKNVNDTLGHRIGDELLCLFSKRVRSILGESNSISRIGGDEFIIYLHKVNDVAEIKSIADRVLEICRRKFNYDKHEFNITASIGAVFFPDCGHDTETLIRNADIAMYQAKQNGRNQACIYNRMLNQTVSRRVQIENELYYAIQRNEFTLHYQPIYRIKDAVFYKAEALLRWNNKTLGFVSPMEFIGVAEDIGIMNQIGHWVVKNASDQIVAWREKNIDVNVNVNISAKQLLDPQFLVDLKAIIDAHPILSERMMIEITESSFLSGEKVLDTLNGLAKLGVKIAIDDFGTGYSNLNYLHKLHVSSLKIDKSFIDQIERTEFNDSIILAIIAIGKRMGFNVVAEGVETQRQLDFLKANYCDDIQGYYFSKPLPVNDFETFMIKNKK